MDITQQQYMVALAETGSITNAAKYLGVSQPAISNWLKNIEEQLGVELVIRSKKSITLTPAGQIYLDGARKMIDVRNQTYRAIEISAGNQCEKIVITGTPNGGADLFSRIYHNFKNRFPSVTLQFIESYNQESLQMVLDGRADIALCSVQKEDNDDLAYVQTGIRELVLLIPYGFPTAYDASDLSRNEELPVIDFEKIRDLPFIMPSPEMSFYSALTELFHQNSYQPKVIFQSSNAKTIYNMVKSGNGIGVVSRKFFSPLDRVSPYSMNPRLMSHSMIVCKKDRICTPTFQSIMQALESILTVNK